MCSVYQLHLYIMFLVGSGICIQLVLVRVVLIHIYLLLVGCGTCSPGPSTCGTHLPAPG